MTEWKGVDTEAFAETERKPVTPFNPEVAMRQVM